MHARLKIYINCIQYAFRFCIIDCTSIHIDNKVPSATVTNDNDYDNDDDFIDIADDSENDCFIDIDNGNENDCFFGETEASSDCEDLCASSQEIETTSGELINR